MAEKIFADSYEFNMKKIYEMLFFHIREHENFEYFCKEDEERINVLTERLNNIMALDEEFKNKFVNDLNNTMCYASSNSFENGLRVGLSLLKSLLTAEMPEIHVVHHETPKTDIPVQPSSDLDSVLVDYLKNVIPYLKREQKILVYSDIKAAFLESAEETLQLF